MKATDLFCGVGGASLGLHQSGYQVTGYDSWLEAVETHNANGLLAYHHDLSDTDMDDWIEPCDLLWASPPCQPFSIAGSKLGEADPRNGFPWYLRILERLQPAVTIVENVKGLTFGSHAQYLGQVIDAMRDLGYNVEWKMLNAADFGVAQIRERCFIIGRRDGGKIAWPLGRFAQTDNLFGDSWMTPAKMLGWDERHPNWEAGQTLITTITTKGLDPANASRAIFSLDDLAVLQGFPDVWEWPVSDREKIVQIGNAVPPVMSQVLSGLNRPTRQSPLRAVVGKSSRKATARQTMSEEIKAIGEWHNNGELIYDCWRLGYLKDDYRTVDPTYGLGRFWTKYQPSKLWASDLDPLKSPTGYPVDFTDLPFEDQTVDAVVFDPPYKLNGKAGSHPSDAGYGVATKVQWQQRHDLIFRGISEAARVLVPGGMLLVKCQDQVSSGKVRWQTIEFSQFAEREHGFRLVDMMHLVSFRPQPEGTRQVHARRNYSSLLVLKKGL